MISIGFFYYHSSLTTYIPQAVRSKDESAWGLSMDEELMFATDRTGMGGGAFAEDTMFS